MLMLLQHYVLAPRTVRVLRFLQQEVLAQESVETVTPNPLNTDLDVTTLISKSNSTKFEQ